MALTDPSESTLYVAPEESHAIEVRAPTGPEAIVARNPSHARRRHDVDVRQQTIARILDELSCEGVVLLMPSHVAWFTGGMAVRGLVADSERPGIFVNATQRWLICSNADTFRLFDEELDGLGFQLKEWQSSSGRALLLGELIAGKRIAVDRPYPNLPMINERLRTELRPLSAYEAERLAALGRDVAHALEAAARSCQPGETEADVAGQIAHRLMKHGITPDCLSIAANGRGEKYRRLGFTSHVIQTSATLQATASRDGLHATASRTVHFGPPTAEFRKAFDDACKLAAVYRSMSKPEESMATAAEAGRWLLANGPHEYEWRRSSPGYGTGRLAAEELRRMGQDEPFGPDQALVWQARIGPAAVVDTVLVTSTGPLAITPPEQWPFKRIRLKEIVNDIPDLLIR